MRRIRILSLNKNYKVQFAVHAYLLFLSLKTLSDVIKRLAQNLITALQDTLTSVRNKERVVKGLYSLH
jgi:hypothetical protein